MRVLRIALLYAVNVAVRADSTVENTVLPDDGKVAVPESVFYIQGDFNINDQDPVHLTDECKAAVSLHSSVLNDLCSLLCLGYMEHDLITEIDFYSRCKIDKRLLALNLPDATQSSVDLSFSRCFGSHMPAVEEVMDRFDVDFPGKCQSVCQEREGCAWFSVGKTAQMDGYFRCMLFSEEAIALGVAITSVEQHRQKYCDKLDGTLAKCAFTSNICYGPASHHIDSLDILLGAEPEDFAFVSGPVYCRSASNAPAAQLCMSAHDSIKSFKEESEGGYVSHELRALLVSSKFEGTDRLFGKQTKAEWMDTFEARDVSEYVSVDDVLDFVDF